MDASANREADRSITGGKWGRRGKQREPPASEKGGEKSDKLTSFLSSPERKGGKKEGGGGEQRAIWGGRNVRADLSRMKGIEGWTESKGQPQKNSYQKKRKKPLGKDQENSPKGNASIFPGDNKKRTGSMKPKKKTWERGKGRVGVWGGGGGKT